MELFPKFATVVRLKIPVLTSVTVTVYSLILPRRCWFGMGFQDTLMLVELWFAAASITGGWLGAG